MGEAEQGTRDHGLGECPIVIPSAARDLLFRMGSRGRSLPRIKSGVGMTTQSTEGTLFRIPNPESRSEARREGKECVRRVDRGGRRIMKKNNKNHTSKPER